MKKLLDLLRSGRSIVAGAFAILSDQFGWNRAVRPNGRLFTHLGRAIFAWRPCSESLVDQHPALRRSRIDCSADLLCFTRTQLRRGSTMERTALPPVREPRQLLRGSWSTDRRRPVLGKREPEVSSASKRAEEPGRQPGTEAEESGGRPRRS